VTISIKLVKRHLLTTSIKLFKPALVTASSKLVKHALVATSICNLIEKVTKAGLTVTQ
jgi:hypothetical protein